MKILATSTLERNVVCTTTAETVATVNDLVYDLAACSVMGFEVLATDGKYVLPVSHIKSASDHQILVENQDALQKHEDEPAMTAELMRGANLQDVEVKTTQNVLIGNLNDLEIDLESWSITGFQIDRGALSGTVLGQVLLPSEAAEYKSPTLIVVTPEVALSLESEAEQLLSETVRQATDTASGLLKKGQELIDGLGS